ncbi:MAG: hypothetical protein ACI9TK_000088 [Flavobacteriaceae bacterium]|jgi:hypothetical protein|tara:strand:- start:2645 stop:3445 length:801 start_codon:yes stop_codon:yes gene_type:complete
MTIKPLSVVHSVLYDEVQQKAIGVRVILAQTKETQDYFAKVVFVTAATLNINLILLNSKSKRFPNGLGNDNGLMGKYIAFHNYRATIKAKFEGFPDKTTEGAKPTSHYVPRFRNVYRQETDFLRGYAAGFAARPARKTDRENFGSQLKEQLLKTKETGVWNVNSHMMGETIPKESNQVTLDQNKVDAWGIPLLNIAVDYDEKMIQDFFEQFTEMFKKAGFVNIKTNDNKRRPGNDIHEMGEFEWEKTLKHHFLMSGISYINVKMCL